MPIKLSFHCAILALLQANKFKEAEEVFMTLLDEEKSPLKPDQKMFHMMIYMYKKAGGYEKARKLFALMAERGVQQSTVTYNSLMSFETNYKEVSKIYDQVKLQVLCDLFFSFIFWDWLEVYMVIDGLHQMIRSGAKTLLELT